MDPTQEDQLMCTYELLDSNPSTGSYFQAEEQVEVVENIMIVLEEEEFWLKEVGEGKENVVGERVVLDPEEHLVLERQILD